MEITASAPLVRDVTPVTFTPDSLGRCACGATNGKMATARTSETHATATRARREILLLRWRMAFKPNFGSRQNSDELLPAEVL
jgi:hypothetical protein